MDDPAVSALLKQGTTLLDVRPILERGGEPFGVIMEGLAKLAPGQGLAVRATFEPKPLYAVLAVKGYGHQTRRLAEEDWLVEFLPQAAGAKAAAPAQEPARVPAFAVAEELDVRGLEPPEPMMRILGRCRTLGPGDVLKVVHDHRPELLYPRLDAEGLLHRTEETPDGLVHLAITRPALRG